MYISDTHLKEFLLDAGLVSKQAFEDATTTAAKSGNSIGEELVSAGAIGEDELRRTQAYILGIPFVNLANLKIDDETLGLIPEPVARRNNIIVYKKHGDELEVAMLNTDDLEAIDFIKKKTHLKILPRLTDVASIKYALKLYQKSLKDNLGDVIKRETEAMTAAGGESDLQKMAEGLPAVRVVDTLLRHAIAQNASDIHIEPQEDTLVIRYRIDGLLHDAMVLPRAAHAGMVARIKVLASLRLDEKRLPQDGRFAIESSGERVSFRVSILPTYYGEKVVIRILRERQSGFTLEKLGFHGTALEQLHDSMRRTTGLILTTGPTGAGKSTTLYTLLDLLNTPDVNISTVEDPIEYQMQRINQTQVQPDIGFTFASGLRSLVRQDPDIIMVGEIRDKETASLAINAALTGHLVLSTLHTNSAAGAIPRLLDMGIEPFLLVSTLRVIIGQRLVRQLCESRESRELSRPEVERLEENFDLGRVLTSLKDEKIVSNETTWKSVPFFKEKADAQCPEGFSGRMGIYEVLAVNETIKELVIKGATSDDINAQARKDGMLSMGEDGIFKCAQGVSTIEEVLRVISE